LTLGTCFGDEYNICIQIYKCSQTLLDLLVLRRISQKFRNSGTRRACRQFDRDPVKGRSLRAHDWPSISKLISELMMLPSARTSLHRNGRTEAREGGAQSRQTIVHKRQAVSKHQSALYPFHFGLMSAKDSKDLVVARSQSVRASNDSFRHDSMYLQDGSIDNVYARKCDLRAFVLLYHFSLRSLTVVDS